MNPSVKEALVQVLDDEADFAALRAKRDPSDKKAAQAMTFLVRLSDLVSTLPETHKLFLIYKATAAFQDAEDNPIEAFDCMLSNTPKHIEPSNWGCKLGEESIYDAEEWVEKVTAYLWLFWNKCSVGREQLRACSASTSDDQTKG